MKYNIIELAYLTVAKFDQKKYNICGFVKYISDYRTLTFNNGRQTGKTTNLIELVLKYEFGNILFCCRNERTANRTIELIEQYKSALHKIKNINDAILNIKSDEYLVRRVSNMVLNYKGFVPVNNKITCLGTLVISKTFMGLNRLRGTEYDLIIFDSDVKHLMDIIMEQHLKSTGMIIVIG